MSESKSTSKEQSGRPRNFATGPLPDFRIEVHFSRWEFTARYHLTASDMESVSLGELLSLASAEDREAWEGQRFGYTPTWGEPRLLDAIADTYDGITANEVIVCAGGEEAIYCLNHVLLDADSHAIVLAPNYQSAEEVPRSICAITGIPLRAEHNWSPDPDAVRAAIRPNTRLIAVNFPNNPTGGTVTPDLFAELIEIAEHHGIYFFSDEIYRGLERPWIKQLPQAADVYERAISLNGVSKSLGMPGLRIGWLACQDRQLIQGIERFKHYLSVCNASPSEILARIAIRARAQLLARNRAIIDRNLAYLELFFAEHESLFEWRVPAGGCVAYPRYLGGEGVEEFCRRAVEDAGVLLMPASAFQSAVADMPHDRFRMSFGRADMTDAVDTLGDFINNNLERSASSGLAVDVPKTASRLNIRRIAL